MHSGARTMNYMVLRFLQCINPIVVPTGRNSSSRGFPAASGMNRLPTGTWYHVLGTSTGNWCQVENTFLLVPGAGTGYRTWYSIVATVNLSQLPVFLVIVAAWASDATCQTRLECYHGAAIYS